MCSHGEAQGKDLIVREYVTMSRERKNKKNKGEELTGRKAEKKKHGSWIHKEVGRGSRVREKTKVMECDEIAKREKRIEFSVVRKESWKKAGRSKSSPGKITALQHSAQTKE